MSGLARSTGVRVLCWGLILGFIAIDAKVSSNLSLGLLYFVPLVMAALALPSAEVLTLALLCSVARVFFGPVGDPLGLQSTNYHVSQAVEFTLSWVVASLGYFGVALVGIRLRRQEQRIRRQVVDLETDPLTGIGNRRALLRFLEAQKGRQVALLALDLDHFKVVNDQHGHAAGDEVLRETARRLIEALRGGDLVVRAGGEEFVVGLPGASAEAAALVAERICTAIRDVPFAAGKSELRLTISIGAARGPCSEELLGQADRALYRAKNEGRDRVVAA